MDICVDEIQCPRNREVGVILVEQQCIGPNASQWIKQQIMNHLSNRVRMILLDMSGASGISEQAVSMINYLHMVAIRIDGCIKLYQASDAIVAVFRNVDSKFFPVNREDETIKEACASFFPVEVSQSEVDGVAIVRMSGKITLGEGTAALRNTVRNLLESGKRRLLFDLGNVSYVDSSGIGEFVSAHTRTYNQGGELRIINMSKKLHELFCITKLITVFEIRENEAEALESLR